MSACIIYAYFVTELQFSQKSMEQRERNKFYSFQTPRLYTRDMEIQQTELGVGLSSPEAQMELATRLQKS